MMSKGRDVSVLFPNVVLHVFSNNTDVKKLVYMYIVHYAELAPNEALMGVNAMKRELASPNQLKRAHALRTLSSIRVKVIAPVIIAALQKVVKDTSPYVLKAAAHAIPKILSVEPSQEDVLIDQCLSSLLSSSSPIVMGSAVGAFNEICPERYDLIHTNFRTYCDFISDVDQWGQVQILELFLRYARKHFTDPNIEDEVDPDEYELDVGGLDPDHRFMLNATLPLLKSANAAVWYILCYLH